MDEQDKWYELRTRNNIRTQQIKIFIVTFKNPLFLKKSWLATK